jgi:mRNA interferase RelE/StbE
MANYEVVFLPRAERDLMGIEKNDAMKIISRIANMSNSLAGDVIKLKGTSKSYRLRVGKYRVLFDMEGNKLLIQRVRLRREGYD